MTNDGLPPRGLPDLRSIEFIERLEAEKHKPKNTKTLADLKRELARIRRRTFSK